MNAPSPNTATDAATLVIAPPTRPAHVIRDDAEAIARAHEVAAQLAEEAIQRDRDKRLPLPEVDLFSQSGLWGIRVPKSHGGAEVSFATLAEVFTIIAAADPSIAQIAQAPTSLVHAIQKAGTPEQRDFFLKQILLGHRFSNGSAEFGRKIETQVRREGDDFVIHGRKFYTTGALLAHYVAVIAPDEDNKRHAVLLERHTPGLTIIDDWDSFGQRTTVSGTLILDNVKVPAFQVLPVHVSHENSPQGAIAQLVHAALDIGIGRAAIADAVRFVRNEARPAINTDIAEAWLDPYTIQTAGNLHIQLHAAEALLARAGHILDRSWADPNPDSLGEASIAVAEAKVLAHDLAIEATNRFFELAGTRSTLSPNAYDRHWRNARVHSVHDAVRWKRAAIGNYHLNGVKPPRGAQI